MITGQVSPRRRRAAGPRGARPSPARSLDASSPEVKEGADAIIGAPGFTLGPWEGRAYRRAGTVNRCVNCVPAKLLSLTSTSD